jgi:UDP-glucose 4-epimerase
MVVFAPNRMLMSSNGEAVMKKVFITGGTGFIGQHVVAKLLESSDLEMVILTRQILPDKKQIRYVQGNLADLNLVRQNINECDSVLHLAGCKKDPLLFESTNIKGTENVLSACESSAVKKLIYLSSVGVIGENPEHIITEKSECMPTNEYEKSKYTAELSVKMFSESFTGKTIILRPSNVFGEDDPERHLLNLIKKVRSNKFMFVGKDTSQYFLNYVYVKEISEIIFTMMMGQPPGGIFIINTPTPLKEFISNIQVLLNNRVAIKHLPFWPLKIASKLFDFVPKLILNPPPINSLKLMELTNRKTYVPDALMREINWKQKYSVQDALNNLILHYTAIGLL